MVVYDVVGQREQVPRQVPVDENQGLVVLEEVLVLVETDRQEVKQVPETVKQVGIISNKETQDKM